MKKPTSFVCLFALACCLSGCGKEAASVGLIGGADGPTAIFVTPNIGWPGICGVIGVIAVAVLAVLFIRRTGKKK